LAAPVLAFQERPTCVSPAVAVNPAGADGAAPCEPPPSPEELLTPLHARANPRATTARDAYACWGHGNLCAISITQCYPSGRLSREVKGVAGKLVRFAERYVQKDKAIDVRAGTTRKTWAFLAHFGVGLSIQSCQLLQFHVL